MTLPSAKLSSAAVIGPWFQVGNKPGVVYEICASTAEELVEWLLILQPQVPELDEKQRKLLEIKEAEKGVIISDYHPSLDRHLYAK
jgi:hypothetical protein